MPRTVEGERRRLEKNRKTRGLVKADEFFEFYVEKRRWARTFMILPEKDPSSLSLAGGQTRDRQGPGRSSFKGMFDIDRWATYCGITRQEYDSLEHRLREWKKGRPTYLKETLVEIILTNLGRPDLYAVWFLDDVVQQDAA